MKQTNHNPVWSNLAALARRPLLWVVLAVLAALGYGYAMAVPAVDMLSLIHI